MKMSGQTKQDSTGTPSAEGPDTGDDSLFNVRRLRADIRELERDNARLRDDISLLVCAILKRNGKDVTDMTAMDRLKELHANEAILLSNRSRPPIAIRGGKAVSNLFRGVRKMVSPQVPQDGDSVNDQGQLRREEKA